MSKLRLTPAAIEKIAKMVRMGGYPTTAGRACGFSPTQISRWLSAGEKLFNTETEPANENERLYLEFFKAVNQAEAQMEMRLTKIGFKAAKEDAKYALAWIGRREGSRWGRKDNVHMTTKDETPQATGAKERFIDAVLKAAAAIQAKGEGNPTPQPNDAPAGQPEALNENHEAGNEK